MPRWSPASSSWARRASDSGSSVPITGFTLPAAAMAAISAAMAATPARPALLRFMKRTETSLPSASPMGAVASGPGPWPVPTIRPPLATSLTSAGRFTLRTSSCTRSTPLPSGELEHPGGDVLGAEVDHRLRAEAEDEVGGARAARRGEHAGAQRLGQLHRGRADAARGALDEDGLALAERSARHEGVVRGGERHADGRRVDERQALRHADDLRLGDEGVLGVAALAADAEPAERHRGRRA